MFHGLESQYFVVGFLYETRDNELRYIGIRNVSRET